MNFPTRCVRSGLLALALMGAAFLAGCATRLPDAPKTIGPIANPHYKVGAPYKVGGKWYAPKVDTAYDETGVASWYGDEFNGRLTANGEIFDKRRLSAAHKTLPLPTLVEVENLSNGRKIVVRVNDRGPFVGDRIIDLSHAAARELGFEVQGTANVRVRYLSETEVTGHAALPGDASPVRLAEEKKAKPLPSEKKKSPATPPAFASALADDGDRIADLIASATASSGAVATASIPAAVAAPQPSPIWVEVAEISDLNKLARMQLDIPGAGPLEVAAADDGRPVQVLRLGPFSDEQMALSSLTKARSAGFADAKIVRAATGAL